jgi:hypothetical protein
VAGLILLAMEGHVFDRSIFRDIFLGEWLDVVSR